MSHFVRLSKDRCTEMYISTVFVVYYLLCAKGGKVSCDQSFMNINLFYLFGTMADLLKYDYNKEFGIFDMLEQKNPISYQLNLFEFFGYLALSNPDDIHFLTFCVDALDFINFRELELLPVLKSNWKFIDELFQLLVRQMSLLAFQPKQISKI